MEEFFYRHDRPTVIRAVGEDVEDYLQSQWSIDLRKLNTGSVRFGLRLSLKGKVLAGAHLARLHEEEFLLITEKMAPGDLKGMLEENVVADEVEFFDESQEWECFSLKMTEPEPLLAQLGKTKLGFAEFLHLQDGLFFSDRRMSGAGYSAILKKGSSAIEKISEGLPDISEAEYNYLRMKERNYSIPQEVGPDDLPQEAGLEKSAVDFTKGCYLGQEVMARLHAMGKVQREFITIRWENESQIPPTLPATVIFEKKNVGQLKSLVKYQGNWLGVAKIHLKVKEQAAKSGLSLEDASMGRIISYD